MIKVMKMMTLKAIAINSVAESGVITLSLTIPDSLPFSFSMNKVYSLSSLKSVSLIKRVESKQFEDESMDLLDPSGSIGLTTYRAGSREAL